MSDMIHFSQEEYLTPEKMSLFSLTEKKSIFYAAAYPAVNEQQAADAIRESRERFKDARHHPYAWVLTDSCVSEKSSDDGEPSGTAGAPILMILRQMNAKNLVVIVSRIFGGILLGTGRLSRSYAQAAGGALRQASLCIMMRAYCSDCSCSYANYAKLSHLLQAVAIGVEDVRFGEKVSFRFYSSESDHERCLQIIRDATCASAVVTPGRIVYLRKPF